MGTRTLTSLLGAVRDILQDTKPDLLNEYRYSDAQLLEYLNSGYSELQRIRPDAWLAYVGQPLPYVDSNAAIPTDPLPVDDIYFQPLVYWIAGNAELRDDTFTVDGRAATLLSMFTAGLTMPLGASGG